MKSLLIILSLTSVAWTLPPTLPINCVPGCTCKDILPNILNVAGCDEPLTINSSLFSHLDRRIITVMSFSNVIIEQITEDAFKRLPNLDDVIITRAQIGSVDQNAFNNVEKVKFSDCSFEDIPVLSSEKLLELHFGNCKLDEIPDLDDLFSLTFLNLSGNAIKEIDIDAFAELFELKSLILSDNEISRIPANMFVNNEDLSSLYLDNNPLKMFHLNTSNKLETLSLKNCYLSAFDEQVTQRLTSLSELNLSNNRIKQLQAKDLAHMTQLTVIDVSKNNIKRLDDDIFRGNPNLQKVTLDGNKLENLPNFTLPNEVNFQIYSFSCKNCGLKTVHPHAFKKMPAIINLNLSYNNFTFIQNMLQYITSLRMLDISYNNLQILTGAFDDTRNLESINLAGNPLEELNPENFVSNKALKKIDATDCQLRKLWSNNATDLSSLRKLYIGNNKLTTISLEDIKIVPGLTAIDLHGNPLVFDEKMCKVIKFFETSSVFPVEYNNNNNNNHEGTLSGDIDNFTSNGWSSIRNNQCRPFLVDTPAVENVDDLWKKKEEVVFEANDVYYDDDYYDDDYNDSEDNGTYRNDNDDGNEDTTDDIAAERMDRENVNLARFSYILSVTCVFVLTALAVLIFVVVLTLYVLRRNNFNMHKANLPRFKIPLWESQLTEKKHSGSIYRPLSEDLSGPKTPKMSRYEFTATPTVHSSNP